MAGRFVFQKFASGMSRSTNRLGAHASASVMAAAPVIPRASEAGIRTLTKVFHGAAVHPGALVPNHFINYAARYLNADPCSSAAAKIGWSTTGTASSTINHKKSAFVDSVRVK